MATTLMLNPRKRRASRKSGKRAPSAKQRANWARFAKMARARRSSNPAPRRAKRRSAKRHSNPVVSYRARTVRRRRNPIKLGGGGGGLLNLRSYITMGKDAAVMGVGAVAMDMAYAYATPYLPAMLQRVPGRLGLGDLAKMVLTVAFGKLLAKPTRGLSMKAAQGALIVQARDIALTLIPTPAPAVAGLRGLGALPSPGAAFMGSNGLRRNWTGTGMATPSGVGQVVRARAPLVNAPRSAQLSAFYVGSPQLTVGRR